MAKKEVEVEVEIEIGILKIKDLGFMINDSIDPGEESQIQYNLDLNYNLDEDWIEFTIEAEFRDSLTEKSYLNGKVLTRFQVKNLKNFINPQGINLPPEIMTTMFSMSFTHTRAILAKNTVGSKFGDAYLPIINPVEVLNHFLGKNRVSE